MSDSDSSIYNKPSTPRAEYVEVAPDITLIRDLLAGTRRMHEKFKDYIAKFSAEKPQNHKRRATSAKVYGGLSRTLSAAVGMLFAKPPQKSADFTAIEDDWKSLDGKGTGGDVIVKRRAKDALTDGFCVIVVDHPPQPINVDVHAGNDRALGLRPIWASYPRSDVISWRTRKIDNVETLSQIVLREGAAADVGEYGTQKLVRYRVPKLVLGRDPQREGSELQWMAIWVLLEEKVDTGGRVTVVEIERGEFRDKNGVLFDRIPAAPVYSNDSEAAFCAQPPLLDVAWANLEHWRVATDLRHYESMCALPQPTLTGDLQKDPVTGLEVPFAMGPTTVIRLKEGGDFKIVELTGDSLEQLRRSLEEKKTEIGELGMSFLARRPNAVESAEAKRLDATAENATLGTSAQGIQDGINLALSFHAKFLGLAEAPTLTINRDFDLEAMDAATMQVYLAAVVQAGLPARTLLEIWQAGGRLPADADLDAIEAEMLAGAAAIAEQKALDAKTNPPIPA